MFPEEATREIYWNIQFPYQTAIIFIQSLIPLGLMIWGLTRQYRRWLHLGQGSLPYDKMGKRLGRVVYQVFSHFRLRRKHVPGTSHGGLFYGILLLFIGTIIVAIQQDIAEPLFGWYFFDGSFYLVFSLVLDLAGLAAGLAIGMFFWRRYVTRPDHLGGARNWSAVLWLILAVLVTGFLVEGVRIAATQPEWGLWSPVGWVVAQACASLGPVTLAGIHQVLWWVHLIVSEAAMALIGYTALNHIFFGALNIFHSEDTPNGIVVPLQDFETAEEFGVSRVEQFTKKQLLDAVACVECGRCEEVCPAHLTGKPLNPKQIVGGVRRALESALDHEENPEVERLNLLGDAIQLDALWACTTCGACEEECPLFIPEIDKIVDMRRHETLMESRISPEVQNLFNNLESQGNPWGLDAQKRMDWAEGLDVPVWENPEDADVLLWVGCAGAFDDRAIKVTRSLVTLLRQADVSFAVLGNEERCTGDSALRLGNDYLYEMLVSHNVETLQSRGVKKIVTSCPHCLQSLAKDYRAYGTDFDVEHHSQFLARLIQEGRLKSNLQGQMDKQQIALHDSCYLGRHNDILTEPRAVVGEVGTVVELERKEKGSFCCGAGGGRMWMEETTGKAINKERSEEALRTGANVLATSCPFCKTMLDDGIKHLGKAENMVVRDIAELLADGQAGLPAAD
jgi:Fe-S oxidoreductase/nitrate reductase gamma subunit